MGSMRRRPWAKRLGAAVPASLPPCASSTTPRRFAGGADATVYGRSTSALLRLPRVARRQLLGGLCGGGGFRFLLLLLRSGSSLLSRHAVPPGRSPPGVRASRVMVARPCSAPGRDRRSAGEQCSGRNLRHLRGS